MSKKADKKLEVKTWQISFFLAAIILLVFLLLQTQWFRCWMEAEIPNRQYRTLCVGMILTSVVFLMCGVFHHYLSPVIEKTKPSIRLSPMGVFDR
jgi:hypothetical protein